jgi:hypothetical protein
MPERAFFKLRCKPGTEAEYVARHRAVWPAVQADLRAAGARGHGRPSHPGPGADECLAKFSIQNVLNGV